MVIKQITTNMVLLTSHAIFLMLYITVAASPQDMGVAGMKTKMVLLKYQTTFLMLYWTVVASPQGMGVAIIIGQRGPDWKCTDLTTNMEWPWIRFRQTW